MSAPSDKSKSNRRSKKRKPREKDPLKLVLSRGLNTVTKTDENGDERIEVRPKGVVLGPVQTMVLASFIQTQQQTIDMLLADDEEDAEEETADASA